MLQTTKSPILARILGSIILVFIGALPFAIKHFPRQQKCPSYAEQKVQVLEANPFVYECGGEFYIRNGTNTGSTQIYVDLESFEVLPDYYAKDKNNVYYVAPVGDDLFGGHEFRAIAGADPTTFDVLNSDFSSDAQWIYYLDSNSWEILTLRKDNWPEFRDNIEQILVTIPNRD
ncbi:hypothetical protein Lepto7376_3829 [[Leptolyngbya] sp. PCC 7376]|uniref:DKNYY domain-containing protein n=1 Tax=[Leptolyngbya] sp. PCC 7376 TaxID=111781 RepID=UPI00029F0950|nr:DKNYY domain-containing protein [[Leptolyngbya] sp. PCC 7376]AFY39987.1 hypothetical protein Lepto7376_3829 [[Leptolyngbya] sp. PCC 7376]